jgi:uncharacterized membrane protein YqjE
MEAPTVNKSSLTAIAAQFARQLLIVCHNRIELLTVEAREERERLAIAFLLGFGSATFAILAGISISAAIVVILWKYSPVFALLSLGGLYTAIASFLFLRLRKLLRNWQSFPATLDQLRKDVAGLKSNLE